jgi:hypothetical protein
VFAEIDADEIERAAERRRSAPMHPENNEGLTAGWLDPAYPLLIARLFSQGRNRLEMENEIAVFAP